jgi:hypothetical protein
MFSAVSKQAGRLSDRLQIVESGAPAAESITSPAGTAPKASDTEFAPLNFVEEIPC